MNADIKTWQDRAQEIGFKQGYPDTDELGALKEAEIADLRSELESLKIERDTFRDCHRLASDRVCDLEAEVERLRAEKEKA